MFAEQTLHAPTARFIFSASTTRVKTRQKRDPFFPTMCFGALRFRAFLREEGGTRSVTEGARATQEIHLAIGKEIGNALREAYRPCVFCVKYSNIRAPQAPSPDFVGSSLPEGALKIRFVLHIHYRQMPRFGLRIHHRWASHCVFKPFSDENETKTGSAFVPHFHPAGGGKKSSRLCFVGALRLPSLHHWGRGTASAVEGVRLMHPANGKGSRRIRRGEKPPKEHKIHFFGYVFADGIFTLQKALSARRTQPIHRNHTDSHLTAAAVPRRKGTI